MKPKSYSLPALCTSYICTSELKKEITSVAGAMIPCQSPAPARATSPDVSGWLINGFGPGALSCMLESDVVTCTLEPGAQAASRTAIMRNRPTIRRFFISASGTINLLFVRLCYSNEEDG